MSNKEWLTIDELAEELKVSKNTIYDWRHKGTGPRAARLGNHLRFRRQDVEKWIEQHMDAA